ncbi:UNVERIFIED_CONTAM: hypothetical protein HDU68_012532 [Siphonaria sp. JEL0065]|nr:hypothetical protein HDU68_012532 [Siphonaria sp. JEL0065]
MTLSVNALSRPQDMMRTAIGQFKNFDLTTDHPAPTRVQGQAAVPAVGIVGDVNYHPGVPAIAPHLNFDNLNKQLGYWKSLEDQNPR